MSGWDQEYDLDSLAAHLAKLGEWQEELNADPHERGLWGMHCWNGLSAEQQEFLRVEGYLEIGFRPEGPCLRGAQVEITTMWDEFPGPRFLCRTCAVEYLAGGVGQ
jgi:hypothetical protein